jgi:hypothetical protein
LSPHSSPPADHMLRVSDHGTLEVPVPAFPVVSNSVDCDLGGSVALAPNPGKKINPDVICEQPPDVSRGGS